MYMRKRGKTEENTFKRVCERERERECKREMEGSRESERQGGTYEVQHGYYRKRH
jgi:hypothetical protein